MSKAQEQITEWVSLYTDDLVRWAFYKTKDQALAEDFVQETFIASYKNHDKFQGKSSPKTWLYSILKNKIADHFRNKLQQNMVRESDMQKEAESNVLEKFFDSNGGWLKSTNLNDWDYNEEELLDNNDFNSVLKGCIESLNEKSYLSIQYKYIEGKDGKAICQELGITPSNFWQILHRAKLQLRECIDHNWFN